VRTLGSEEDEVAAAAATVKEVLVVTVAKEEGEVLANCGVADTARELSQRTGRT
jgi:hypothetical protein